MVRDKLVQKIKEAGYYAGVLLVLYLFYKSPWVLIPFIPCAIAIRRMRRHAALEQDKKELNGQFRDMLISMAASLRAGYSVENALLASQREMEILYGDESLICKELVIMKSQMRMGISTEEIFREFALRSHVEDIDTFSSIFSIAKRTGGNMVEIIGKTARDISDRLDTRREIDVVISAKKLEQNILTLLPAVTILYIDLTSPGLLDPLYGNVVGVLVMTACLGLYGAAVVLAGRIMDIQV